MKRMKKQKHTKHYAPVVAPAMCRFCGMASSTCAVCVPTAGVPLLPSCAACAWRPAEDLLERVATLQSAIELYTALMQRVYTGSYEERSSAQYETSTFPEDGVEKGIDALQNEAAGRGLQFVWQPSSQSWSLEPIPVLEIWQTAPDALESPGCTWYVFDTYQNVDLKMLHCRIVSPDKPNGEIAECSALFLNDVATRIDTPKEESETKQWH